MRNWTLFLLLGSVCAVFQLGLAEPCDLSGKQTDQPFPNIEKLADLSYMISAEYTTPAATRTDLYTEYYDILGRAGRVDSQVAGQSYKYIYKTETGESWKITSHKCSLLNMTEVPEMHKEKVSDWIYNPEDPNLLTIGPSAMFKNAYDTWKSSAGDKAYMGVATNLIREMKAQYWRHCSKDKKSYTDYYFTVAGEIQPYGESYKDRLFPLRVYFSQADEAKESSAQQYDITFRPFIPGDLNPFRLPKGLGCKRNDQAEKPDYFNLAGKSFFFSSEVIYRKVDYSGKDVQYWSYYSTLMMALDIQSQHLAYHFTPWETKKQNADQPTPDSPEFVVFDMKHGYAYQTNMSTAQCEIIREKNYYPKYELPENGGSIALSDPSILYPNSEFVFISEGTNRGLAVNIFEEVVEGYPLDLTGRDPVQIPKAIITHSYLQTSEIERHGVSVRNAPTQIQLIFMGRYVNVTEILTFNIFGLTTKLHERRDLFNIHRCFKNDDDYLWASIGFNANPLQLKNIRESVPSIQSNILDQITMRSELNPVRIPIILVDIREALYVNMLILGKPPILLDFLEPEDGKKITGTSELEGVADAEICAANCLEKQDNCWGFSLCGAVCAYGSTSGAKVSTATGCKLYRRYNNDSFIPSKELMVENLRNEVKTHLVKLVISNKAGEVSLDATSIEVTEPGEDDKTFEHLGHTLNSRLILKQAGAKLKKTAASGVTNLGRLRYDECQNICLDYRDCETVSYCLTTFECLISKQYGNEISSGDIVEDNMCNLLTRKYGDHFDQSPGIVLSITAEETLKVETDEECAKACLTSTKFQCQSFDHCPTDETAQCKLHTVHYPNPNTREKVQKKDTNCGHFTRKYSTEFKAHPEKRSLGTSVPPLTNVTLEECSKTCMEYGEGICYGFDFCQNVNILATSCILLDKDPEGEGYKTTYSPFCTNYWRTAPFEAAKPYTNSYAGGIGFLCFLIGLIAGAFIVFGIAYLKVNRR